MTDIDDAEWVGVDYEFGKPDPPDPQPQPPQPSPPLPQPPLPLPPATEPPHDGSEVDGRPNTPAGINLALLGGSLGGVLGLLLVLMVVLLVVFRRKLTKAKVSNKDASYQLRVEDVAHLSHLDETSNTYVNTTDLQRLVATVRAKDKSANGPPTPPQVQHQTPKPFRPAAQLPGGNAKTEAPLQDHTGYRSDPDVVVVRAPLPVPQTTTDVVYANQDELSGWTSPGKDDTEVFYSNLQDTQEFSAFNNLPSSAVSSNTKVEAPKLAPPPPPAKQRNKNKTAFGNNGNNTVSEPLSPPVTIARPAPPPPKQAKSHQTVEKTSSIPEITGAAKVPSPTQTQRPTPPPPALKPNKFPQTELPAPISLSSRPTPPTTCKPTPPTTCKPTPPAASKPTPPTTSKPTPPTASKPTPPTASKPTPPTAAKRTHSTDGKPSPPTVSKPTPPTVSKPTPPTVSKPTPPTVSKPTPPTLPKPGIRNKGKALPPLKMALQSSFSRSSLDEDYTSTPDTGIINLTPESTTTAGVSEASTGSINAKIAFLEGKMGTSGTSLGRPVLPRT